MSSIFIFNNDEESNTKINIDELYEKKQRRDLKQIAIFNKILNRIHKRITHTSRNKNINDTHIWFLVPEYLVGEPIYDKGECIAYIVNKLQENGFHTKYMFFMWKLRRDDSGIVQDTFKSYSLSVVHVANMFLLNN